MSVYASYRFAHHRECLHVRLRHDPALNGLSTAHNASEPGAGWGPGCFSAGRNPDRHAGGGPFLDKAGAKSALGAALALIAVALAVMPTLGSYHSLIVAALAYGLGGGILNTATNALVAELNTAGRASALNLLGFFFSLGAVTAPLLMSSLGAARSPGMVLR